MRYREVKPCPRSSSNYIACSRASTPSETMNTLDVAMERCSGPMEAHLKGTGSMVNSVGSGSFVLMNRQSVTKCMKAIGS